MLQFMISLRTNAQKSVNGSCTPKTATKILFFRRVIAIDRSFDSAPYASFDLCSDFFPSAVFSAYRAPAFSDLYFHSSPVLSLSKRTERLQLHLYVLPSNLQFPLCSPEFVNILCGFGLRCACVVFLFLDL